MAHLDHAKLLVVGCIKKWGLEVPANNSSIQVQGVIRVSGSKELIDFFVPCRLGELEDLLQLGVQAVVRSLELCPIFYDNVSKSWSKWKLCFGPFEGSGRIQTWSLWLRANFWKDLFVELHRSDITQNSL